MQQKSRIIQLNQFESTEIQRKFTTIFKKQGSEREAVRTAKAAGAAGAVARCWGGGQKKGGTDPSRTPAPATHVCTQVAANNE